MLKAGRGGAQVIKRFIMHAKKTAFIVEHDFIMATYLADRVIVYEGQPSVNAVARTPQTLVTGEASHSSGFKKCGCMTVTDPHVFMHHLPWGCMGCAAMPDPVLRFLPGFLHHRAV